MATQSSSKQALRIDAEELKERIHAGESTTLLDVRSDKAWESSDHKIAGSIRCPPDEFEIDPFWPHNRLTVAYCT
jgi:rhodanese-related sulfurtransferase